MVRNDARFRKVVLRSGQRTDLASTTAVGAEEAGPGRVG
jgi:hypothetical protein